MFVLSMLASIPTLASINQVHLLVWSSSFCVHVNDCIHMFTVYSVFHRPRFCSSWSSCCHLPVTLLEQSSLLHHRNKPRVFLATKVTLQSLLTISFLNGQQVSPCFIIKWSYSVCGSFCSNQGLPIILTDKQFWYDYNRIYKLFVQIILF